MNKYRNKQKVIQGHVFDSKKESERFLELRQWKKMGKIAELDLQPSFTLQGGFEDAQGKKHQPIIYFADFMYRDQKTGEVIVEDVKGIKTEVYRIKKKLFLYKYNLDYKFIES